MRFVRQGPQAALLSVCVQAAYLRPAGDQSSGSGIVPCGMAPEYWHSSGPTDGYLYMPASPIGLPARHLTTAASSNRAAANRNASKAQEFEIGSIGFTRASAHE